MIVYLLQSSLCLAIVLGMYYAILEREKILRFNRYFLILGLLASHLIPFVQTPFGIIKTQSPQSTIHNPATTSITHTEILAPGPSLSTIVWEDLWMYGYLLIVGLLLLRLVVHVYGFRLKRHRYPMSRFEELPLVLTDLQESPHSFWRHIYSNKEEYDRGSIKYAVLLHEATHVRQWHSIDIILINVLQAIGWINPLYYLYKRAIQINHEYLADQSVTEVTNNIREYQHLLLDHIQNNNRNQLASNLNFLITKKRLLMMTKRTSRLKAFAYSILGMVSLTFLVFLFGEVHAVPSMVGDKSPSVLTEITKVPQSSIVATKRITTKDTQVNREHTKTPSTIKERHLSHETMTKAAYFKEAIIVLIDKDGNESYKKYVDLSRTLQKALPLPPPPPPAPPGYDDEGIIKYEPLAKGSLVYFNYESAITIDGTVLTQGSIRISRPSTTTTTQVITTAGTSTMANDQKPLSKKIGQKIAGGTISKDEFYHNASIVYIDKEGNETQKLYTELTVEQKNALPPPPPPPPAPIGVAEYKVPSVEPLMEGTVVYVNNEKSINIRVHELSQGSIRLKKPDGDPSMSVINPPAPLSPPPAPPAPPEATDIPQPPSLVGTETISLPPPPPAPPTPPDPIEELKRWDKEGASFFIDGEEATLEQAIETTRIGLCTIDVRGGQKKKRIYIKT